jgi:hypothetical protein
MNKQEIRYILYSGGFALIWFMVALPFLVKTFDGGSVTFQFFAFNLGLFAFFFLFLKSITTSTGVNIKTSIGLLSMFLALDVLMPEYHVAFNGELIQGATMGVSTTDYFFGFFAQNTLHFSGMFVYIFTYILTPIILLFIAAKLIPNFVKSL